MSTTLCLKPLTRKTSKTPDVFVMFGMNSEIRFDGKSYVGPFQFSQWVVPDLCAKQTASTITVYYISVDSELRWVKLVDEDRYWDVQNEDWTAIDDAAHYINLPEHGIHMVSI